MKKMLVTLMVQAQLDFDEMDEASYEEQLEQLVPDLEDMELKVVVESEESSEELEDELY